MSIKKIAYITNMAVFKNFDWDRSVRDEANNKLEFKRLNILYGRNYSGKTTLSRIIRALETYKISDKYSEANFQIEIEDTGTVSLSNLSTHTQVVRVFNEDFVKENLQFLFNEKEDIQSFAILGDKNIEIESQITYKENELGTEEPARGLCGEQRQRQADFKKAENAVMQKTRYLENLLKDQANNNIKRNPDYQAVTYNITKIKEDISKVSSQFFKDISADEVCQLQTLLKEKSMIPLREIQVRNYNFQETIDAAKALIEKKITLSNPIRDLIEDSLLESWVRLGITHHKGKRKTCGFCGSVLPLDLIENLNKHFNKESEQLRVDIETLISQIEEKKNSIDTLISIDVNQFYSAERDIVYALEKKFKTFTSDYKSELNKLVIQLKRRLNSISIPIRYEVCSDNSEQLFTIINDYNIIIKNTNEKIKTLSANQNQARNKLRLNEVSTFLKTIKYSNIIEELSKLQKSKESMWKNLQDAQLKVDKCKSEIDELKTQLKDEKKGAEQVNKYLNNYFGHEALKLVPIDTKSESGNFRFEIQRHGEKAYHLSEGECSLVAFCYFMAKLNDTNTKDKNPIIWIDDPISSLDSNHVFFIYSLINGEIVKANKYKQLFISTHNLDFLKYLKRLMSEREYGKKMLYFIVQRKGEETSLSIMPQYMVKYVTEFNYLFHRIYQCANADIDNEIDSAVYYDFGNNARKFLELFLAFKYPNPNKSEDKKLEDFIGASCTESLLVSRINNEYSHLYGVFERGMIPIEIPEMKKTARFILQKLYENDKEQFNSLLESIGEEQWT